MAHKSFFNEVEVLLYFVYHSSEDKETAVEEETRRRSVLDFGHRTGWSRDTTAVVNAANTGGIGGGGRSCR